MAQEAESKVKTKDEIRIEKAQRQKPPLNRILNLQDMEVGMIMTKTCLFANEAIGRSAEGAFIQGTRILFFSIRR
jgi:hypothetical protein